MKRICIILITLFVFSSINSQQLKKIAFVPHWLPQAQFAGYYVAKDLGIYEKYGIDLNIIAGGPRVSSSRMLIDKKADFTLMWLSNAIQLRANKHKIVNIAQIVNRSALMLISKKSSGINTPQDMNGKRVGIWGGDFSIQPMAFFKQNNLDVTTIMQGNSINLFFFDGIDLTSAMWYNEYHTIINSGFNENELNTFFFADYGLNFPEEGIYCSEDFFIKNPELCRKFVEATIEGWKYSFEHPEEAIEIIIKYIKEANLAVNLAHQRWMLNRMEELIFPYKKMNEFGELSIENYTLVGEKLKEEDLIDQIPAFNSFYKPVMKRKSE